MSYTIAMCGMYHVDKYGDVLFPTMFQEAMKQRGEDAKLVLFSSCDDDICVSDSLTVHPITMLESLHAKQPFDAVMIGGGDFLRYGNERVPLRNGVFADAALHDVWYTPLLFAAQHRLKVLFHAPLIPTAFADAVKEATAAVLRTVDHLAVCDEASAAYVKDVLGQDESIEVCPDPFCGIASLFTADSLEASCSALLPFTGNYAVVQFDLQRPVTDDEFLVKTVLRLREAGLEVLLLPFGEEQYDDIAIGTFNEKCGGVCHRPQAVLSSADITAVLSGCTLFIGNDVYGAIAAMAYGHTAVAYSYGKACTRLQAVFARYGVPSFVGNTAAEVYSIVDRHLKGLLPFVTEATDTASAVSAHYDAVLQVLRAPHADKSDAVRLIRPLVGVLPTVVSDEQKIADLTNDLQVVRQAAKEEKEALRGEIEALRADCAAKEAAYITASNDYTAISRSFFWRMTSPFRRLSQALKNFVSKRRGLMKAAVALKGFLRGGPKGAKRQLAAYSRLYQNVGKLTLSIPKSVRREQEEHTFPKDITFSILVPLYNTPTDFLEQMIRSVELQTYGKWELCLADGSDDEHAYVGDYCLEKAKADPRIKYRKLTENKGISENTNACIEMATGEYIALFDHDDVLDPTVLYEYMVRICDRDADFLYCDEDKFHEFGGELYDANFKPDFAVDNLRSNNYICHFTVFKTSLLEKSGVFRKEFDGSQDHDLVLRLTEQARSIVHIPKVLYHWRVSSASVASDPYAKPYTIQAGRKAVAEHLERVGLKGTVGSTAIHPNIYRVKYEIIGNPLVSIIIPNYNHVDELSRCIDSIMEKSTYRNFEIIIVENNSDSDTFAYYDTLKQYDNIKVVVYKPPAGFNYSAINNFGVQFARGEHYILLNNDVEIITPEWIEEMLMYSQREDVGAVGAMLYYPNDTIQHAGVTLGVLTLAGHNFKHMERGNPGYFGRAGYAQNVTAVTAACLMLPASVYKEVNGLDESFAVAFNDIDFCMRIRKAGHLIVFTPFAELYHHESISRGDDETPEKRARFVSEVTRFQERWKKELEEGDPYYNPNLTLDREDFSYR